MGSRWEWWQHYQLHRRRGCPYRSGRQVINRVRNDNIVAKITIHCKGNDPSWGMPAVTAGRWMVLKKKKKKLFTTGEAAEICRLP
jgi:hypothetical protein